MRRKCDNKEEDLNQAHPFPRVLGYMRINGLRFGATMLGGLLKLIVSKIYHRFVPT
jgi:hypothetical protein